ncbi:hypothetical protein [Sphingomonas gellani]|nr:hypothetical protein [Sphingomonas gellani]
MILAQMLALQLAQVSPPPAPEGCAATSPLTSEYEGWYAMQGVSAGTGIAAPATLALGRSVRATLVPVARVTFPAAVARSVDAGGMGGVFAVDVDKPGVYRLAEDSIAWIDMVAGDKLLTAVAHGHGPECSGIRKYVDFRLTAPGRYLVQVAGSKVAGIALMVSRVGD